MNEEMLKIPSHCCLLHTWNDSYICINKQAEILKYIGYMKVLLPNSGKGSVLRD